MKQTDFLERIRHFYNGVWYPVLVALLVFVGYCTNLELYFGVFMLATMMLGCFLCDDLRFAISPFLCTIFAVSVAHSPNVPDYSKYYIETPVLITLIITAVLLIESFVYFTVKHRHRAKPIKKKAIFWSMLIFCISIAANGLFGAGYTIKNLIYSLSFAFSLLLVYWLFSAYVRFENKAVFDYFMYCLMIAGMLISAELIFAYFTTIRFDEAGGIIKESVVLGWGVWTAVGGMLAFLMPSCFYFAASHTYGWIGFLLGGVMYACILLSQARGALLVGSVILLICLASLWFYGKNRKQNRIFTLVGLVIGVLGCVLLWGKISSLLDNFITYGFSDNGRFDLWRTGIEHFKSNVVFGAGFYTLVNESWPKDVYPYLYHNTLIQLLGACGLLGIGSYLYHRSLTLRLALYHCNTVKLFLGISILSLLLTSFLDVLFFNTYPTIFYSMMLLFMEKTEEQTEMEPCLTWIKPLSEIK
ncbi:MAG: O-antigen ligase family protein [Clostridia bacterium]|nr:O-antigen ligase family protein [Clostridia bacterium]